MYVNQTIKCLKKLNFKSIRILEIQKDLILDLTTLGLKRVMILFYKI